MLILLLFIPFICCRKYIITLKPGHHNLHHHINHHHIVHNYTHGYAIKTYNRTLVRQIRRDHRVHSIEPDQPIKISNIQNDVLSWGIDRIDQKYLPLDQTFHYNASAGTNVNVFIIDSGINIYHEEFQGHANWGANFVNNVNEDENGHGTHVAGIVGGQNVGVARQANLIAVKVIDFEGNGMLSDCIAGLDWVLKQNKKFKIINMSLSGVLSPALDNIVNHMMNENIVFVSAAGNNNADACFFSPNQIPSVIVVGATDQSDNFCSFSNYGSCVDINAPGELITSAWIGSNSVYRTMSGTSQAAPHISGMMATYWSANPLMTNDELIKKLKNSATNDILFEVPYNTPNKLTLLQI